jgi:CheY-like chemotaxis protein
MRSETLHLLIVEDDKGDAALILRLLKRHPPMVSVAVAKSAPKALSLLRGELGHPPFISSDPTPWRQPRVQGQHLRQQSSSVPLANRRPRR